METTKHTSGPWKLNESDLIIENSNGYAIARIIGDSNKQINVYDGKLIASAPELLAERAKSEIDRLKEVNKELLEMLESANHIIEMVKKARVIESAIAKAKQS